MRIAAKVGVDVDPVKWAENNNGPWPEDDIRSLNVAVRHDVIATIRHAVDGIKIFEELGIEVEVK